MDELRYYLAAIFANKGYKRVIEFGCAFGTLTSFLTQLCDDVTGIDLARKWIELARRRVPKAKFEVANLLTYKAKEKFDVGITHGVLIHVEEDKIEKAIKNILRNCKEALLVESSVAGSRQKDSQKYDAKKYWNNRASHSKEEPEKDLPMKYYYQHDYEEIFKRLGLEWQLIKTFNFETKTRLYLIWNPK